MVTSDDVPFNHWCQARWCASVQRRSATSTPFLQPRPRFERFFAAREGKCGVAKEEVTMSMRVRSAFDAMLDGAVLGLAAVAAGLLALWWMFPF